MVVGSSGQYHHCQKSNMFSLGNRFTGNQLTRSFLVCLASFLVLSNKKLLG